MLAVRRAARSYATHAASTLAGDLEEVGAHGVEPVRSAHPVVDGDRLEEVEAGAWPVHHRFGDGAVEGDGRARDHPLEEPVERHDLRPVGVGCRRCLVVHGGDGSLQLVRAERLAGE